MLHANGRTYCNGKPTELPIQSWNYFWELMEWAPRIQKKITLASNPHLPDGLINEAYNVSRSAWRHALYALGYRE